MLAYCSNDHVLFIVHEVFRKQSSGLVSKSCYIQEFSWLGFNNTGAMALIIHMHSTFTDCSYSLQRK